MSCLLVSGSRVRLGGWLVRGSLVWFLGWLVVVCQRWFGGGGGILRVAHSRVKGASRRASPDDGLAAVTLDPRASATLSRLNSAGRLAPACPARHHHRTAPQVIVSRGLASVPDLPPPPPPTEPPRRCCFVRPGSRSRPSSFATTETFHRCCFVGPGQPSRPSATEPPQGLLLLSPWRRSTKPRRFLDQRQPRWLRRQPPPEPGGPPRGHSTSRCRQNPWSATVVDNFSGRVRANGTVMRAAGRPA
jgi:hypothetical protein